MADFQIDASAITDTIKSGVTTVKASAEYMGRNVVTAGKQGISLASSALDKVVQLVRNFWSTLQPMISNAVGSLTTPMGLCGLSFAGSFYALYKMAPEQVDPMKRAAYTASGLCLAVLCGVLGAQAGVFQIPAIFS